MVHFILSPSQATYIKNSDNYNSLVDFATQIRIDNNDLNINALYQQIMLKISQLTWADFEVTG